MTGIPFTFAAGNAASGASSYTAAVTASTTAASTLLVAVSGTATASTALAVADSQGNKYELILSLLSPGGACARVFECSRSRYALTSGMDTVTVTMAGTGSAVNIIGTALPGAWQRDMTATTTATGTTGTTQSATTPGTQYEDETVIAVEWASTYQPAWQSPVTLLTLEAGSGAGYLTTGWTAAPSPAAVTVSSATSSAPPSWALLAIPYYPGFPDGELDIRSELEINGTWTDVTSYLDHGPVSLGGGHPDESTTTSAATMAETLTNTTGIFSSKNPASPLYPYLMRNTPSRISIPAKVPYLRIEADQASCAEAADATRLQVTGALDFRCDMKPTNYQAFVIGCKADETVTAEFGWALSMVADGSLWFLWTPDGSTTSGAVSTVPVPLGRVVVRAVFTASTGTVTFYTGTTMTGPWTQLGAAVSGTGGASSSIYAASGIPLRAGYCPGADTTGFSGSMYGFQLWSGTTLAADAAFTAQAAGTTSWPDPLGNAWTLSGTSEISNRLYRGHYETPEWPQHQSPGGQDVTVAAAGGGLLRRIQQRNNPASSTMYRAWTKAASDVAAYWPMEDGAGSAQIASGTGGPSMYFSGTPTLASNSDYACSSPLPVTNGAVFSGLVPAYDGTWEGNQVSVLLDVPSSGDTNDGVIASIHTTGTIAILDIFYYTGGGLGLVASNAAGTQLFSTGAVAFAVNGAPCLCWVSLTPSGSSINWKLATVLPDAVNASVYTGTQASASLGAVTRVQLNTGGLLTATVLGHCAVQAETADLTPLGGPLNAWLDETAGTRFGRLCSEEGIQFRARGNLTTTPQMGVQSSETITQLLQECADADRGQWTELRQQLGFGYTCRQAMYNQPAQVTVDYDQDHLSMWQTDPLEDDQTTVNDVIVTQTSTTASVTGTSTAAAGGSSARQYAAPGQPITGGRLSTLSPPSGMGTYDQTYSINLANAPDLNNEAGWIIHVGTVDQPRYPGIVLDLSNRALASLFWDILDLDLCQRLVIDNPPAWLGPDPVSQLVQGFAETLFYRQLEITAAVVPELPYEVAADGCGYHVDTDGSALASAAAAGTAPAVWDTAAGWAAWAASYATLTYGPAGLTITANGTGTSFWQAYGPPSALTAGETVAVVATIKAPQALGAVNVGVHISGGSDTYTQSASVAVTAGETVTLCVTATAAAGQTSWQPYVQDAEDSPSGDQMDVSIVYGAVTGSLPVATSTGYPLWTTAAANMPFDVAIGGERVTVAAVSGTSSPQAMTAIRAVNGVVKAQAAGTAVALFSTPYAAL